MNERGPALGRAPTLSPTVTEPREEHDHAMRGHRQHDRRAAGDNGVPANGNDTSTHPTPGGTS